MKKRKERKRKGRKGRKERKNRKSVKKNGSPALAEKKIKTIKRKQLTKAIITFLDRGIFSSNGLSVRYPQDQS